MVRSWPCAAGLVCCLLIAPEARLQNHEFGITGGVSYYLGDLNPVTPFKKVYPAFGALYKRNLDYHFSLKAQGLYGRVGADDLKSRNGYQHTRNLRFTSPIAELSGALEFNFFAFEPGNAKRFFITPYLFLGVGAFYMNPQTTHKMLVVDLRALGTEGQNIPHYKRPYRAIQPMFPFGIGLKYNPFKGVSLTAEWGMRLTFTDYLDDVSTVYVDPALLSQYSGKLAVELADQSVMVLVDNTGRQRGFKYTKDWYSYAGLHLTIRIPNPRGDCWRFRHKYRFPRIFKKKVTTF